MTALDKHSEALLPQYKQLFYGWWKKSKDEEQEEACSQLEACKSLSSSAPQPATDQWT